jgi:hypothetical protein
MVQILLSMMLFTLAMNPLLAQLEESLAEITLGPKFSKYTCVAYVDDITVIVTS